MTSGKWTLLRVIVCGVLVGLVGCQYIKPITMALSLFAGRRERIVRVEVVVPQADGEPTARSALPLTGE